MNTTDLTARLAEGQGLTNGDAKKTIELLLAAIVDAAVEGQEVSLPGFGKFKVKTRAAKEGRNPATGAKIKIAASRKLSFSPAKAVQDSLNPS
jgi:DNA-binding protein HU-beta